MTTRRLVLLALLTVSAILFTLPAPAAEPPPGHEHGPHHAATEPDDHAQAVTAPAHESAAEEQTSVTHHSVMIAGQTVNYTATAGYLPIRNEAGKPQAEVFFMAYTRDGVANLADRPITFAFNGGPGACSVWLHLGALGPKRVVLAADGTELPEADRLVDNDQSWLDFTDLVFVDPVGTGYSHAADGVDPHPFYALVKDIEVTAQFIRTYVTKNQRWLSPKFVAGESYGTTRAAAVANRLQDEAGLNLRGVILLSSVLSFEAISYDQDNDLAFALAVPTMAAAASYHKKAPADQAAAEKFVMDDLLLALARGDALPDDQRKKITHEMAGITGLSEEYLENNRLRVSGPKFTKELLRGQKRTVGLMDTRVLGVDVTPAGDYSHSDPAFFTVTGPYVATLNDYIRRDLKFESSRPYEHLSNEVHGAWKWDVRGQGYVYVADDLAEAMARDAHLRVFDGAGLYDLTTPYFGQKYTLDHMGLDASRRGNLVFRTYPSGHQIYTDLGSLKALHEDVGAFVRGDAVPQH